MPKSLADVISEEAEALVGAPDDFNSVIDLIGVARFVLIGEASHSPHYGPETELMSHYFHARLPDQFDAIMHYDHTRAVEPLERTAEWEAVEVEETFPSGL